MKKILLLIVVICAGLTAYSQGYNSTNSLSRKAFVYFHQDKQGIYHKKVNVDLDEVGHTVSTYGYNKKTHELYLETDRANCVVVVSDVMHKVLKKVTSIPQLSSDELITKANEVTIKLEKKFDHLNAQRLNYIKDSLEHVKQEAIRKAREDSLKEISYKENTKPNKVPFKIDKLYCDFCEKYIINTDKHIWCNGIKGDTIVWLSKQDGYLGLSYSHIHLSTLPLQIQNDKDFQYHHKIFKDSLNIDIPNLEAEIGFINAENYLKYIIELKRIAPNGFFVNWDWNSKYSSLEFEFRYMNTNKKTIKYIEVFFTIKNDVGDICKTGSFRGTGPLEELESAKWSWEHTSYYLPGDASKMGLSKVVVTYMDGSKVTIPKNKIQYN